jgi:glutaredoxin 3
MQPVTVYSTPTCHYCHMAKEYFDEKGVSYTDIDVSKDMNAAREMITKSGQRGVPVIKIGDNYIVGFDQGRIDSILGL